MAPVGPRKPAQARRCRSHIVRRPGRCICWWTSSQEAATGSGPWRDGIRVAGEGAWQVLKHGASRRRQWRKIHIGVDADTLEVRAVEMTSNRIGDVEPVKRHRFERTGEVFCPTCWRRSRCMSGSAVSPPTAFMTPGGAMPPSQLAGPMPSYRHDEMPGTGRDMIPACRLATKPCAPASASDGPTGRNGPDITDEVAWRPK